jgi:serine protease Do
MIRIITHATLTFAIFMASAGTALAASDDGLVYCFDQERDLVTRRAAVACRGKIVDRSVAEQARQRRIQRIRGQIDQPSKLYPNRRRRGSGTGFFVTPAGALLTNNHVIAKCDAVSVQPMSGPAVRAKVDLRDAALDLALLQVDLGTATTPVAVFRNSPDRIGGGTISVVGFPLHGRVAIKPIFITGRAIDAWTGDDSRKPRFRIKADIRRGNSGGPVMDVNGLVIGVVTAKVNTPKMFQSTGRVMRNVGIAISRQAVLNFLKRHNVDYSARTGGMPIKPADVFARARHFVARVLCWK